MWFRTSTTTQAWVTWRPADRSLHYPELYKGVWEFVRMPPRRETEARGREYLDILKQYPNAPLQRDRIRWVTAWLNALPGEEARRVAMGEKRYWLLTTVCYESPVETWRWEGVGQLRAG